MQSALTCSGEVPVREALQLLENVCSEFHLATVMPEGSGSMTAFAVAMEYQQHGFMLFSSLDNNRDPQHTTEEYVHVAKESTVYRTTACKMHSSTTLSCRQWRMDSGEYAEMAGIVMDAWAQRCASCTAAGQEPPAWPHLMHSNLSSLGDIAEVGA